ncbi:MAG: hypothetical protein L3J79_08420, partial [Candidatus Marinimicrobia bacterium]|nr:hypothetical protein [Candidatus Neomarinimicrobiota bacterium]
MRNATHTLVAVVGIAGVVGGLSGNVLADSGPAGALHGSGEHLYIDGSTPDFPEMEAYSYSNVTNTGFDAGWSNSVLPAWRGSFSATGPTPAAGSAVGTTTVMDFSGLQDGELMTGTFFNFSDLDGGSGSEAYTIRAYDSDNMLIEGAWLSEIVGVKYINGSPPNMNDMPSWSFASGEYNFVGNHTGGNPNDLFALTSLRDISYLEIDRTSTFNGFSLGAPVPTPGAMSLLAVGG